MASPTHRISTDSGRRDPDKRLPTRAEVDDGIRQQFRDKLPATDQQGRVVIPAAQPPTPSPDPAAEIAAARAELAVAQARLAAAKGE